MTEKKFPWVFLMRFVCRVRDATNLRKGLDLGPKPLDLVLDLYLIADIGFGFEFVFEI
jgi:hypothetical protein